MTNNQTGRMRGNSMMHGNRDNKVNMSNSMARARYGFTLVELIAVIVILAIAALISVPVLSNAGQMQLTAAAQKLAADLEYAKSLAISTQRTHQVAIDVTADKYLLQSLDENGNAVTIDDPIKRGSQYIVEYASHSRLNRVTINSATLGGASVVRFDYMGSPASSSGSFPSSGGTIVLENDGQTVTVHIEPVTGYITIR